MPVVQVNDLVAVLRERYQRRSRIVHATPVPGLGRSRSARSHIVSVGTYDSQWTSLPQGPAPPEAAGQWTRMKLSAVAGVLEACLA